MPKKRKPTIYKIINIKTNKFYIGSSTNYDSRRWQHTYDLRHNIHHCAHLQNAWNKYGETNFYFEVVKEYKNDLSDKELKQKEQKFLDEEEDLYNSNKNAFGWHNEFRPVVKLSISDKILGFYPSIMAANIDLGVDPYDYNIGDNLNGRQSSAHGFKWICNKNRKSNEEIIDESKSKTSKMRPIRQIDITTGEVVNEGYVKTFIKLGFDGSAISKVIKGQYKKHKNYFFEEYNPFPEKIYILGIDSGKKGAMSILNREGKIIYRTPLFLKENGNYDILRINDYIYSYKDRLMFACLEEIHSIFGTDKNTAFKMGYGLGMLQAILICNKIQTIFPKPKEWQKAVWIKEDVVYEKGKKKIDTKATSLNAAQRLFPSYDFLATKRSSVPHDGIIDATLIAWYGKIILGV
jgi:group I intron endonuclease